MARRSSIVCDLRRAIRELISPGSSRQLGAPGERPPALDALDVYVSRETWFLPHEHSKDHVLGRIPIGTGTSGANGGSADVSRETRSLPVQADGDQGIK